MRTLGLLITIALISGACARQVLPQNGTGLSGATESAPGASGSTSSGSPAFGSPAPSMGTINGGGGIGIRCNGRLETLDLYEARAAGLTLVDVPASREAAIALVARIFSNHFWNVSTIPRNEHAAILARDLIAPIFDGKPFMNYQTEKHEAVEFVERLPLSNDLGSYTLPKGCSLEQVAFFSDVNTRLSIVKKAWDELDWLSKSILNAHEVAYMLDRREGLEHLRRVRTAHTSESTRRFVGRLFTVESLPTRSDGVPAKDKLLQCTSTDKIKGEESYFYAFDRERDGKLTLVFNQLRGKSSFYQMRADFAQTSAAIMTGAPERETSETAMLTLSGSKRNPKLEIEIIRQPGKDPTLMIRDLSEGAPRPLNEARPFSCDTVN